MNNNGKKTNGAPKERTASRVSWAKFGVYFLSALAFLAFWFGFGYLAFRAYVSLRGRLDAPSVQQGSSQILDTERLKTTVEGIRGYAAPPRAVPRAQTPENPGNAVRQAP